MGFRMCGRLLDAFTDALDEISRTDSDWLDEQRRCAILQIMKCPQIDVGAFVRITKQAIDKGCNDIAVGLREWSNSPINPTHHTASFVRRMMGDVGQPNFAEISAMKVASRCPSQR